MRLRNLILLLIWTACPGSLPVYGQAPVVELGPSQPMVESAQTDFRQIRHLYIPESQLGSIFRQDEIGAILPRTEFEALVKRAREGQTENLSDSHIPLLTSVEYRIRLADERLIAEADFQITSIQSSGEVDLNVTGWNVQGAKLNDQPAQITRIGEGNNILRLFVPQAGKHVLQLELSSPLKVVGGNQHAMLGVAAVPVGRFVVSLPAGKFLHFNGLVPQRSAPGDQPAEYDLPIGGLSRVDLMVTEQEQASRPDMLTFASTAYGVRVSPSEMTWTAHTELQVFGQSIDRLVCRVPQSLEITNVESPGLESWELTDEPDHPGRVTISLKYRQSFDGSRSVLFQGILSESPDKPWQVPDLTIAQATSHTAVIMIGHPAKVRLQPLESDGVRAVSNLAANPVEDLGAERLYFAVWREDFALKFMTTLKAQQVRAAMTSLLFADEPGLDLSVMLSLRTRQVPLFDARLRLPAEYQVLSATRDGAPVPWEVISMDAGINELRITLNPPLPPGQSATFAVQARAIPEGWPVQESPVTVVLPEVRLPQADMLEGMYGIAAPAEFDLIPQELSGLDPAAQQDLDLLNAKLQATGQQVRLGLTYQDTAFKGQLQIARKPTLFIAQSQIGFRVDRETVFTRVQGDLSLTGGGIRELQVKLGESAGDKVRFQFAPLTRSTAPAQLLEQLPGEVENGQRSWKLTFDRYLQGNYVLWTELELPRGEAASFTPPRISFPQANAQSGFLAIEGPPDEQVTVTATAADGTPLPTVDPVDLPVRSGQTRERIVAGYRFVQPDWNLAVTTARFTREAVPSAIGHDLRMESVWMPGNNFQHEATLNFTAYGMQSLIVQLPEGASLWSSMLDGQVIEARKVEQGIQIPLAGLAGQVQHELKIVYETPAGPREQTGELQAQPPAVRMVPGSGESQSLAILEQHWKLHYPNETVLISSEGQFRPIAPLWNETLFARWRDLFRIPDGDRIVAVGAFLIVALAVFWGIAALVRRMSWIPSFALWLVALPVIVILLFMMVPTLQNARPTREFNRSLAESSAPTPAASPVASEIFSKNGNLADLEDKFGVQLEAKEAEPKYRIIEPPAAAPQAPPPPASFTIPVDGTPPPESLAQQQVDSAESQARQSPGNESAASSPAKSAFATGGLLSIPLGLQIPSDSRERNFVYRGNGGDSEGNRLQVKYGHRSTGLLLIFVIAFGTALMGWWLRRSPRSVKLLYLFVVLLLPLACIGMVPLFWVNVLAGAFWGGVAGVVGWGLLNCSGLVHPDRSPILRWCRGWYCPSAVLLAVLLSYPAHADETYAPELKGPPAVEPHVVIPYKSLEDIDAADRVYVPVQLYRQLWEKAHPEDSIREASVPSLLVDSSAVAKLVPNGELHDVEIRFRWVIVNFTDAPQVVTLPVKETGLQSPLLDDEPAVLIPQAEDRIGVMIPKRGAHIVDATLVIAKKSLDQGEFTLHTLPVPAGKLVVEIPSTVETLSLLVNNTSGGFQKSVEEGVTRFQLPIDAGGDLSIRWREVPSDSMVDANLQLETAILAEVEDSGIRVHHAYDLKVRKGVIHEIAFEIPDGLSLRQASGADVTGWKFSEEQGRKRVMVQFSRPVSTQTQFHVDLFQRHLLAEKPESLTIRTLAPLGVTREAGLFGVAVPDHLKLQVIESQSLQQIDVSQFKPAVAPVIVSKAPLLAYRFISRPFQFRGELSRRDAEARAVVEHGVQIGRRKSIIASRMVLNLTGAPRRMVEVSLPAGYLAMDVVCEHAADWYVVPSGDQQRLMIELDQPRLGSIEIGLEGHVAKNPQDESINVQLPAPADTNHASLKLGVWCDETYQPALVQSGSWRTIASQELPETIRKLRPTPALFAFQATDETSPLEFQLPRAIPEIQADAGILIAVGDATLDYGLTLRWNIANAAADQFAFTVPSWLGNLEITGQGIRQVRSEPAQDGRTRWVISLIDPVRGQYLIGAAATIASPPDLTVQTPRLEFESFTDVGEYRSLAVQRQFAVLVNLSQNQLMPADVNQFESVDVDQLPLAMPEKLLQQAMEIVRVRTDKVPAWKMQRMERAAGSQAVIPSCTMTTILQMDGSWRTQAVFGVRNRGQQFLALKLPQQSSILSVFVRGEPGRCVLTKLGEESIHLIALPQTSVADLSFDVTLMLTGQLDRKLPELFSLTARQVQLPGLQVVTPAESAEFGVTVAQTVWNVFVPEELEAYPVSKSGETNVTFHRGAGWVAAQMQMIERLRGDIAEMKRIAIGSGSYSASQRRQAGSNLKQLQAQLKSQSELPSAYYLRDDVQFQQIQDENGKAILEAEEAVKASEALERQDESRREQASGKSSDGLGVGNRGFINMNNAIVLENNGQPQSVKQKLSESSEFNFYETENRSRATSGKKGNADQDARQELRRDLQSQVIIGDLPQGRSGQAPNDDDFKPVRKFHPDMDKPFRQGSFDLAAPTFGGPDPRLGQSVPAKSPDDSAPASSNVMAPAQTEAQVGATTLGLSVAMTLPQSGHELSFDKPGGNPMLTLAVRPKATWTFLTGAAWCLFILVVGVTLFRGIRKPDPVRRSLSTVCLVVMILGGAAFLFLPGGPAVLGAVAFSLAGVVRALLPVPHPAAV
ncbi:hypothetical protein SH661x_001387 [Planctomicrobium sp. SH661]|uniref:hypothetical protein n=1 Tax=Planctomicrobium sp. SH661 TaxID=3448124 RepID=UPI003F5B68F3